jgi:hypothetical protein
MVEMSENPLSAAAVVDAEAVSAAIVSVPSSVRDSHATSPTAIMVVNSVRVTSGALSM